MTNPTAALPIAAVECPFCLATLGYVEQGNGQHGDSEPEYRYTCESCGAQGPGESEEANAISAWNYRGDSGAPAVQATADAAAKDIAEYIRGNNPERWNDAAVAYLVEKCTAIIRKAVSPKAAAETLEHVHITDKQAVVTGDPADLPDSVPDDDPRRHNCDQMGCPSLDHVLHRLPFTDHRKPVDIKALARQLAESIDFTAGPVQAREAFEKWLDVLVIPSAPAPTIPEPIPVKACGKTDPVWGEGYPCSMAEGHEGACDGSPF